MLRFLNFLWRYCIIFSLIGFVWQGVEMIMLGHLNPNNVDSVIAAIFSLIAYYAWISIEKKLIDCGRITCCEGVFAIHTLSKDKSYANGYFIHTDIKGMYLLPKKEYPDENGSWIIHWLFIYFGNVITMRKNVKKKNENVIKVGF